MVSLERERLRCRLRTGNLIFFYSLYPFEVFFFSDNFLNDLKCIWGFCLRVCLCTLYVPSVHRSQKRALGPRNESSRWL